jgi:hydroxymethylpyrimidine pyrophosphatase-like HAD family hydrolase
MIKEIHIYDMDGTIVDSLHRFRTLPNGKIDLQYWIENCTPEKIAQDTLLPLAEQYQAQLADPEIYVAIATARVLEDADMDYIKNVLGMPNKIVSRNGRADTRKGVEMKIAGFGFLKNLKQFKNKACHFYEDNLEYLHGVADYLNAEKHHIPSKQGV